MRVSESGEIVVPEELQKAAGLFPGCEIKITLRDGALLVEKVATLEERLSLIDRMIGRGEGSMTTDEILALTRGED